MTALLGRGSGWGLPYLVRSLRSGFLKVDLAGKKGILVIEVFHDQKVLLDLIYHLCFKGHL